MDQQDLTVQSLINIPAVRDALLKQKIDVAEGLLRRRLAEIDALQEIEAPLAKAAQVASDAREAYDASRKAMEVARGKLGNAEARLNEVRARQHGVIKRLHPLGESAVIHACSRISCIVSHLENEQLHRARLSPKPAVAEVQAKRRDAVDAQLKAARAALIEAEKLRFAKLSPIEIEQRAADLMVAAGIELPTECHDD